MNPTEQLVLKNDVVLVPVTDLSPEVRAKFTFDEGDYTLSRRHGRVPSQIIDKETAGLLGLFRTPRTIVEAVMETSRSFGKEPQVWLEELLPHLGTFIKNGVLVGADEKDETMRPLLEGDTRIGDFEVLHCISMIEDSEIYRARAEGQEAAIKIARMKLAMETSIFGNEVTILQRLDGGPAPRLFGSGLHEERPWLAIEWCPGVELGTAAAHRRHDRVALLALCAAVASRYAELHERGIVHSDVHPRNILVDHDGTVQLIDFGLSRVENEPTRMPRGGMYYFFEPEFLAATRRGGSLPSSFAGEQYALAAMIYLCIAGAHYLDFRYEREEMARQAENDPPLPLASRGVPPWPEVEAILFRALEKEPAKRFPTVREMANALTALHAAEAAAALATPLSEEALAFVENELTLLGRDGALYVDGYPTAPKASVNYGAAGAAVGLLRIATARSDARLLALADIWSGRAGALIGRDDAYYNDEDDISQAICGQLTPYHTESGIHAAAALIAAARSDISGYHTAVQSFLDAARKPCTEVDLTLGKSGIILAAALLLEGAQEMDGRDVQMLRRLGNSLLAEVWEELDARPPLAAGAPATYFGIAHGWAGYLYATLRWHKGAAAPLPETVERRLGELAALRIRRGRSSFWLRQLGSPMRDYMNGWCNGSGGQVFLWTLAHEILGGDEYLAIAEEAARHAHEEPLHHADLCCGAAGRGYAYLNLYRRTGATEWLAHARQAANQAARTAGETAPRAHSLYKGHLGVATLIADLAAPEDAAMPFFE